MGNIFESTDQIIYVGLGIFILILLLSINYEGSAISYQSLQQQQSTNSKIGAFTLSSEIIVDPIKGIPTLTSSSGVFTITGWGQVHNINNFYTIATYGGLSASGYPIFELGFDNNCVASAPDAFSILYLSVTTYSFSCLPPAITADNWIFYALTYNGISGDTSITYEGVPNAFPYGPTSGTVNSISSTFPLYANSIMTNNELVIGSDQWNGNITNIQVYNAILTSAQINALFANGLTGTPILTSNIVGWYPLNGNANDLSGLGNNGVALSTSYIQLILPLKITGAAQNFSTYGLNLPNIYAGALQLAVFALVFIAVILAIVGALRGGSGISGGFFRNNNENNISQNGFFKS